MNSTPAAIITTATPTPTPIPAAAPALTPDEDFAGLEGELTAMFVSVMVALADVVPDTDAVAVAVVVVVT